MIIVSFAACADTKTNEENTTEAEATEEKPKRVRKARKDAAPKTEE